MEAGPPIEPEVMLKEERGRGERERERSLFILKKNNFMS
jgi:hypothetical protein